LSRKIRKGTQTLSRPAPSVAPLGLVILGNLGPTTDAVGYRLSVLRTCGLKARQSHDGATHKRIRSSTPCAPHAREVRRRVRLFELSILRDWPIAPPPQRARSRRSAGRQAGMIGCPRSGCSLLHTSLTSQSACSTVLKASHQTSRVGSADSIPLNRMRATLSATVGVASSD